LARDNPNVRDLLALSIFVLEYAPLAIGKVEHLSSSLHMSVYSQLPPGIRYAQPCLPAHTAQHIVECPIVELLKIVL